MSEEVIDSSFLNTAIESGHIGAVTRHQIAVYCERLGQSEAPSGLQALRMEQGGAP